jgi:phosphoribosylglycinamide formyltransferase 2
MSIGSPLTPSATKVMLLGSGELGKEVVIALQRFGVEVIAVDRYQNAPGHQVAHRAYTIDMTDAVALKALIHKEKPHLIVPEIEALNTDALAEIEADGFTIIPTVKAVQLTMNREGIRRLAAEELKLPTSPYAFAHSLDALRASIHAPSRAGVLEQKAIGYPCFIKPTMSSSGKGQSRVTDASQLQAAWEYAATGGRVNLGVVIVEGQIDFDYEITLLTVRAKNSSGEIQTYFCEPIGHVQKSGDYVESWQPQVMTSGALKNAQSIAKTITDALGGLGLFGVELFVKGDDVWFSEVSPRPHDTGMVTMCSQRLSEFELHARAILGLPVDVSMTKPGASAVIYGGIESNNLQYDGLEAALTVPCSDVRLFGKPQSFVKRRMGVALATGKDTDEARSRAKLAASLVKPTE